MSKQRASFFAQTARIHADASLIKTDGQCKQGWTCPKRHLGLRTTCVIALRKNLSIEQLNRQGGPVQRIPLLLFYHFFSHRFFFITNDRQLTAAEVSNETHHRCNEGNLISNLKSGVRALHAPVNTLNANLAYRTMTSLAWTLKAWWALMLPVSPRWETQHEQQRDRILTMEFRTFRAALIDIP